MYLYLHRVKKLELIRDNNSTGNLTLKITHQNMGLRDIDGEYGGVESESEIILFNNDGAFPITYHGETLVLEVK